MISYPLPKFEQQKAEILQRYNILKGTEAVNTGPSAKTVALAMDVPMVLVALTERYRNWFRVSHGISQDLHEKMQNFCAPAIMSDGTFFVEDASNEPYFQRELNAQGLKDIAFYAGAPLWNPNGERFGTLCIMDDRPRSLTQRQMVLLESFSQMISSEICLRSAGRYAVRDLVELEHDKCELYDLAMTDPLTSALNRRAFNHFADREISRAFRRNLQLSVVVMDIDHFKQVNDVYGHAAGDEVLKKVSHLIQGTIRDEDIFGRLGGEEFCLILPETDPTSAKYVANRIRQLIKTQTFLSESGPFSVTISLGVSDVLDPSRNINKTIALADQALYQAKREGRDRVVIGETRQQSAAPLLKIA